LRTMRLVAAATAIGAVIGCGIVFSLGRPLEDARSLLPEAINTLSPETSDRLQQPPAGQPAPLPSVSNTELARAPLTATAPLKSNHSTLQTNSEEDKLRSNPTSDATTSQETARPEGASQKANQSSLPIATEEPNRRPKLQREAKRNIATRRDLTARRAEQEVSSRGDDVSAFFRPWWYAYPPDWRRTGG
jgi:hypothetical protein